MKNKSLIPILAAGMFFVACSQDQFEPVGQENFTNDQNSLGESELSGDDISGENFRIGSVLNITADWARGGASRETESPSLAGTNTVRVENDFGGQGIFRFARWDQGNSNNFGRPVSEAINGGNVTHAFAYKVNNWQSAVPFAFGTRPNGTEAIWTPGFRNEVPRPVNMGEFVTDNAAGDEDPTVSIIKIGNIRARGFVVNDAGVSRPRVAIEQWNGSTWVQIMRTDNPEGLSELLSFTVVKVRSSYSIIGGRVSAPTVIDLPVFKAKRVGSSVAPFTGNEVQLWTIQPNGGQGRVRMVNSL